MVESIKQFIAKKFINIVLMADNKLEIGERLIYLWKSVLTFGPIAILLNCLGLWFEDNKLFFTSVVLTIMLNMVLGAWMHSKNKRFSWETFISKTLIMTIVILVTYLVLELMLKVAGENVITETFRAALQVATLLYPGSKILKNIFILSDGEHPPKWVMEKVYKFQENGDLSAFLSSKKEAVDTQEEI